VSDKRLILHITWLGILTEPLFPDNITNMRIKEDASAIPAMIHSLLAESILLGECLVLQKIVSHSKDFKI
jgi:hypothetical protein